MSTSRPRVTLVTQYFAPEKGFITADLAHAVAQVADVRVVTCQPNFPSGRTFDGFRWYRWGTSVEDGVRVTRVPTLSYRGLSVIARTFGYLWFAFFATLDLIFRAEPTDVWVVYQTPFSTAWGVALARGLQGGRVVHIVADLWPESMLASGILREGPVSRAVAWTRRATNATADALIVTTKGMLGLFCSEGVARERMTFAPLWTEAQRAIRAPAPRAVRERYVAYAGTIGPSQPLAPLLEALAILRGRGIDVGARIAGDGHERASLEAQAKRLGLGQVAFLGRITPEEVLELMRGAVAQLVPLVAHPQYVHTVPSKLLGAIGTGIPILAGLAGEARALAEESGLGIPYASDDPSALAAAIMQVLELDQAAREARAQAAWSFYSEHLAPDAALSRMMQAISAQAAARARDLA